MQDRRPLATHLRRSLLGPAEYPGAPPVWLVTEGLVVAAVAVLAVTGLGAASVLVGIPTKQAEGLGSAAVCGVLIYLLAAKSGKLLVGAAAVAGLLLAFAVPRTTADSVLAELGRRQDVVVTGVAYAPDGTTRKAKYLCSVRHMDGTDVPVQLWRGCGPAVGPGDRIGMVYDPAGRVPPRGVTPWNPLWPLTWCVLLAATFGAVCVITVVRSYRLAPAGP
ncbi:hypothetical protein ACIBM4_28750 [Streptomyces sp. NPDC050256]|uniref:hypothetical protein n=1 Tax=Streptomyces sp. NPDC050256 TaxID=3365607 RepID=UPI0037B18A67